MTIKVLIISPQPDKTPFPANETLQIEDVKLESEISSDAFSALNRLQESKFDAVIFDAGEGTEGVRNFIRLMGRHARAPLMIINGQEGTEAIREALAQGISEYLPSRLSTPEYICHGVIRAQARRAAQQGSGNSSGSVNAGEIEPQEDATGGARILVAEDEELQSSLVERTLEKLGYQVKIAASGEEAVKLTPEWKPHLLLTDLYMPGINGIEAAEKIHGLDGFRDLPAIMMSADYEEKTVVEALSSGIYDFVSKPLRRSELSVRIRNVLDLKDKEKQLAEMAHKLSQEKRILSRYFADDFVEKLLQDEIKAELGGAEVTASIMFFDLRNSTGIAEALNTDDFSSFLSEMFNDIMELVFTQKGSVNKLIGDGLLATYGCPIPQPDDALNCCITATRIREYINMYNQIDPHGLGGIHYGIGIGTGKVFAGNIGSHRRLEYTVLGDPVNVASRLEGLTKKAGVDIMIDEATRQALGDAFRGRLARTRIRGRTQEANYYSLESLEI